MRALGGQPKGKLTDASLVAGGHGPGLHGVGHQPGLDHAKVQGTIGLGEHGVRVSEGTGAVDAEVGAHVFVDQRRAGVQRAFEVNHGWQGLVVDLDQFEGVAGHVGVGRDYNGNRLALVSGHCPGHGVPAADLHVLPHSGDGQFGGAGGVELGTGDHRQHARRFPCCTGVDAQDAGVGVGASQHQHHCGVAGQYVAAVPALTLEQPEVLLAPYRGAYQVPVAVIFGRSHDAPPALKFQDIDFVA